MKTVKYIMSLFCALTGALSAGAQVGYQVSLLDPRTGEPRVNEKVEVAVKITDSKGNTVCSETKSVTSDSFGVLSLTIGSSSTFNSVDWNNLPLSISATVGGVLIGSSQILTVPVAEHSKHTGLLTPEILSGKTCYFNYDESYIAFNSSGIATYHYQDWSTGKWLSTTFSYEINGDNVYVFINNGNCWEFYYSRKSGKLYGVGGDYGD